MKQVSIRDVVVKTFDYVSDSVVDSCIEDGTSYEEWGEDILDKLLKEYFDQFLPIGVEIDTTGMQKENLKEAFRKMSQLILTEKENEIGQADFIAGIEKNVFLRILDRNWTDFINYLEIYQQGVRNQTYAGKDPVVEYKLHCLTAFNEMIDYAKKEFVNQFLRCNVEIS